MRSSSTPRCASTFAVSARSRSARKSSATRPASRSSRTRWHRPSSRSSSTSCMRRRFEDGRIDRSRASRRASSRNRAPGSPINSQRLCQGRENAKLFLRENPELLREIETALRQKCRSHRDRSWRMAAGSDGDEAADIVIGSSRLIEACEAAVVTWARFLLPLDSMKCGR